MKIELDFVTGVDKNGINIIETKIYTALKVKTRALREAISINQKIDFKNLKDTDLDELVDFVCGIYGNKFTQDEFYDGLDADKLTKTLNNAINGIISPATDTLNKFPIK